MHADSIDRLYAERVTTGCRAEPLLFCPFFPVTRAQMASFLARALKLPAAPSAEFTDVAPRSVHAANIDRLHAAGITVGCDTEPWRYCPDLPVTRAQMASFLARALSLPAAPPARFTDVKPNDVHLLNIDRLHAAGITIGCRTEPWEFCPDVPVTRAQMASFLVRSRPLWPS